MIKKRLSFFPWLCLCVMLTVSLLNSETPWNGVFWLMTVLLKLENKKASFSCIKKILTLKFSLADQADFGVVKLS